MGVVIVEGKKITLPDEVIKAGRDAICAVLAANGIPAVEKAHIEIEDAKGNSPMIARVAPRSTGKGSNDTERRRDFVRGRRSESPRIVVLCGSTRFYEHFQRANFERTMRGDIVLSVGFYPQAETAVHGEEVGVTPEQKVKLDELHKRKIDLADEVFVLNIGGYIGDSTRSEIEYAIEIGRPVFYAEAVR